MNIFDQLSPKRVQIILLILLLTAFCVGLLVYRYTVTGRFIYLFLIWNLFLAFVPFGASLVLTNLPKALQKNIFHFPLLMLWLLFLPNAFYIITDLFHLRPQHKIPLWFDLLLLLSFAINGLLVGYLSINYVQDWMEERIGKAWAWFSSILVIILCAFGIYLGRYLRWNSWDVIADPHSVFYDITSRFINPVAHANTWGMTISYSAFFIIIYLFIRVSFNHSNSLNHMQNGRT